MHPPSWGYSWRRPRHQEYRPIEEKEKNDDLISILKIRRNRIFDVCGGAARIKNPRPL